MIYCVIGTRAQLIKMAPIVASIECQGWPLKLIHTGQHMISMDDLRRDFDLKTPWVYLTKEEEAKTIFSSIAWLCKVLYLTVFKAKKIVPEASKVRDIVLVHGDTFSTVLGAVLGKLSGASVAHIESGLRSFNIWNPFPEELNRLVTFSLADKAFCPGDWAVDNLKSYKKIEVINTHQNTLIDSLKVALLRIEKKRKREPEGQYGIVSIHRFENIYNMERIQFIVDAVLLASRSYKIIFVLHPVTEKRLMKNGLLSVLSSNKNVELRSRVGYVKFVEMLAGSSFVFTDGGSNQEELAYLGIPTLLMRKTSERPEGLGENVILSNYSSGITEKFLLEIQRRPKEIGRNQALDPGPTKIVVDSLEQYSC